jgi:hypothetical protein
LARNAAVDAGNSDGITPLYVAASHGHRDVAEWPECCPRIFPLRKRKVGYALLAAVPAVVVLRAVLTGKKKATKPEGGKVNPAKVNQARAKG